MTQHWKPHFPNSLGVLAEIKRGEGDRQARITRAHSLIYQALEELRPLVGGAHDRPDAPLLAQAWAYMVDSEALVKELQENNK